MEKKEKILVIEDNDFVRMQMVRYLSEDECYDVYEASRADVALDMVDDSYSVAVVDVRMEPVDGFEFIRSLRSLKLEIAVILVTGDQNPDILSESSKWGVKAVLIKPVQKERLLKTVGRILKHNKKVS